MQAAAAAAALPEMSAADRERLRKLLHDGLGQMLTSATFVATALRLRLQALGLAEAAMADELMLLLNDAIAESRTLAARCEPPRADSIGDTPRPSA